MAAESTPPDTSADSGASLRHSSAIVRKRLLSDAKISLLGTCFAGEGSALVYRGLLDLSRCSMVAAGMECMFLHGDLSPRRLSGSEGSKSMTMRSRSRSAFVMLASREALSDRSTSSSETVQNTRSPLSRGTWTHVPSSLMLMEAGSFEQFVGFPPRTITVRFGFLCVNGITFPYPDTARDHQYMQGFGQFDPQGNGALAPPTST